MCPALERVRFHDHKESPAILNQAYGSVLIAPKSLLLEGEGERKPRDNKQHYTRKRSK
jgi:hypothetical protein